MVKNNFKKLEIVKKEIDKNNLQVQYTVKRNEIPFNHIAVKTGMKLNDISDVDMLTNKVKGDWWISVNTLNNVDYMLVLSKGLIIQVYKIINWAEVKLSVPCKKVLNLEPASNDIQQKYVGRYYEDWNKSRSIVLKKVA